MNAMVLGDQWTRFIATENTPATVTSARLQVAARAKPSGVTVREQKRGKMKHS